jgi:isoleucyl-tRNA synthetase
VETLTAELDGLDVAAACDATRGFLEVLSNWYIRRSRERFWDGESAESRAAFDTLYTVLEVLNRAIAPLLPLTTEEIWRGLTGGRSVHLATGRTRRCCPPTPGWSVPWTGSVRSAPPLLACAKPRTSGSGCRWRSSPWWRTTPPRSHLSRPSSPTSSTCAPSSSPSRRRRRLGLRGAADAADQRARCRAAARQAGADRHQGQQERRLVGGEDGAVTAGGLALVEGEYTLRMVVADADPADQRAVAVLPGGGVRHPRHGRDARAGG